MMKKSSKAKYGARLNYNVASQIKYHRALNSLVDMMIREVMTEVKRLFKTTGAREFYENQSVMDASISSEATALMNKLQEKFGKLFSRKAEPISTDLVESQQNISSATLYASLKDMTGGLSLPTNLVTPSLEEVANTLISANVSLIKSIPQKYLDNVTGEVMRSISSGQGLSDLIPSLEKYGAQTKTRAREIAYDQTRKAYTAINKQKMLGLGLTQFRWLHSSAVEHPRNSHLNILNGRIFSFENLEQQQAELGVPVKDRGLPGYPVNCKCTMQAVLNFEDE